jgi:hypothetical protein
VFQWEVSTHVSRIHNPVICGYLSLRCIVLEIITVYTWWGLCL